MSCAINCQQFDNSFGITLTSIITETFPSTISHRYRPTNAMETAQCTPYENSPSRHKPLRTNEAWDKVVRTIEDLKLQGNLSGAQAKCVREAVDVLKTTQTSGRRKKYKRFLFNVLQESGPQAVLVCAAALGQVKATNMKESDRNLLNRKIDGCKNINHSTIQSLASRYQIPRSEGGMVPIFALGV